MSDDSAVGGLVLGACLFFAFGGCDRFNGDSYELVTSGDTIYRLNKHDGRVSIITRNSVVPVPENRSLHWWDRIQMSNDAISWRPQKFHREQYEGTLKTRWTNGRFLYAFQVSPAIEHPKPSAKLTILLTDRFGMKLVKEDVMVKQMDTAVDKDDKITSLLYQGEINTDERTVKDAAHWRVLWEDF